MTSPFIEGTNIQHAWDSTSLGWLKECPRKYYYAMVRGLVSKGEAIHLEFGILYHAALEEFDKLKFEGHSHDEAVHSVIHWVLRDTWRDGHPWRSAADLPSEDRASLKSRENLVRTLVWYMDKYKDDPAATKALPDGSPMVELNFKFEAPYSYDLTHPYLFCGYLDRVVTFQNADFVMDRKTTTQTLSSYYYAQYDPDNQMSLYTVAAQVAFHTPVRGVIVDAAQIAVGFSRFGRSFASRTRDQVDEWLKDTGLWLRSAERFAEVNYWPMNDKSCHKYGGCPFVPICTKSNVIREKFIESNYDVRPWNPLVPR
jgi:PD-(D/E)XK nuclease superfamily